MLELMDALALYVGRVVVWSALIIFLLRQLRRLFGDD